MNCSLVIRAYNEEQHLPRLFDGIARQTVEDVEIILVDSGSTDSTRAIGEAAGARIVQIPSGQFTFGRSLNWGIRAATRELIVIVSAHVYPVYPDWLRTLLAPFADRTIALCYGKQRAPSAARFSEQQVFLQWYPAKGCPRQATAFCNNANAAIRKSLWEKHAFDESLTGLEDIAWATWAKSQGHAISYVAEAEVIHVHNETPHGIFNRYRREAMAFKRIHPEAHFSLYDFFRLTLANMLSDLWHAARQGVLWGNIGSIIVFRYMQFHGARVGYRESGLVTPQLREQFYYALERRAEPDRGRPVEPIRYDEKP